MLLKILSWRAWFDNFIPNFMLKTFLNFNFSNFCLEKPLRVTMTTHLDIKRNKFIFNFPPGVSSQIILIFNTFAAGVTVNFSYLFMSTKYWIFFLYLKYNNFINQIKKFIGQNNKNKNKLNLFLFFIFLYCQFLSFIFCNALTPDSIKKKSNSSDVNSSKKSNKGIISSPVFITKIFFFIVIFIVSKMTMRNFIYLTIYLYHF